MAEIRPYGDPERSAAWLSVELLSPPFFRCLLSLTLFLTVADVTLPQRGLGALIQGGVGVRWVVGWSEAGGLRKRRVGQDDT